MKERDERQLEAAYEKGHDVIVFDCVVTYTNRSTDQKHTESTEYVWDLKAMTQTNSTTKKKRRLLRFPDDEAHSVLSPFVIGDCQQAAKRHKAG